MKDQQPIESQIIVGLDVGTTKVAAVVGKIGDNGKINILGIGKATSRGLKGGEIVNIEEAASAIREAITQASHISNIRIENVVVGLSGGHIRTEKFQSIITLQNSNREITRDDLNRLHYEARQLKVPAGSRIVQMIPQSYKVDDKDDVQPVGMSGIRLEGSFMMITANDSAVENLRKALEKAGLHIDDIILQPLASARAVLSADEMEAGVCLLDIGGGTTDLVVIKDGIVRSLAALPLGSHMITHDLALMFNILPRYSENLKIKYGQAINFETDEEEFMDLSLFESARAMQISRHNLNLVIHSRVVEILGYVQKHLEAQGFLKRLPAGIVLTGGGAKLDRLVEVAELNLAQAVRIAKPRFQFERGMSAELADPALSTAAGLLMYGFDEERVYIPDPSRLLGASAIRNLSRQANQREGEPEGGWGKLLRGFQTLLGGITKEIDG
jgi:cell division protein FtsA